MSEGMSGGMYPNRKWQSKPLSLNEKVARASKFKEGKNAPYAMERALARDVLDFAEELAEATALRQQAEMGWDESRRREAELRAELGLTRGVLKDIQDYAEAEFHEGEKGYQFAIVAREVLAGQPISGWVRRRSECPVCYDGIDPDSNGYCGSCGWSPISDPPVMLDVNDSTFRTKLMKPAQDQTQDSWQGVYPGMCANPETCRGYGHCPRPYSCSE